MHRTEKSDNVGDDKLHGQMDELGTIARVLVDVRGKTRVHDKRGIGK